MTKFYHCLLLFFSFILGVQNVNSQTVVTAPNIPQMCVGFNFILIDTILIKESSNGDFGTGNGQTYTVSLPTNFQFSTAVTDSVKVIGTGPGISNISIQSFQSGSFTFVYDAAANSGSGINSFKIFNLHIQGINTASSGQIRRTGGTANQTGNAAGNNLNHGSLQSFGNLAITSQPVDKNICKGGSNVQIFDIQASGANLTFKWQRNRNDGNGFQDLSGLTAFYTVTSNATSSTVADINPDTAQDGFLFRCIVSSSCGPSDTSNVATLSVGLQVAITAHPTNQTVCSGSNASFSVTATNAISYQWLGNNVNIPGATNPVLTLNGVTTAANGSYRCLVSGTCGSPISSSSANLTVKAATVITTQPANDTVCVGANKTFSIVATGSNLTYQWARNKFDGFGFYLPGQPSPYSGENTPNFLITNEQSSQNGYWIRCVVTGDCGTVTSDTAINTVYSSSSLNFFGLKSSYCDNSSPDTLNAFTTTGVFSGSGITNLGGGKAIFNPSGLSGQINISYKLGCTIQKSTTVNTAAPIKITSPANPPNPIFINTDPAVNLTAALVSNSAPVVAVFSGTGVSGNQFKPIDAGVGTFPITATYTSGNCVSTTVLNIQVKPPGIGIPALNSHSPYCQNDTNGVVYLTVDSVAGGAPWFLTDPIYSSYYQFEGYFGNGITNMGGGVWRFKPDSAGAYQIEYRYKAFGFLSITYTTQTVQVKGQTAISLTGIPPGICSTTSPFDMIPSPGVVSGASGTSISVISPSPAPPGILSPPFNEVFNPGIAGSGSYIIKYHFINSPGGCVTDLYKTIVVNGQPPKPVIRLRPEYCVTDLPFQMVVDTLGLNVFTFAFSDTTFKGVGSAVSGQAFVPTTATPGKHNIRYTYSNPYGCGNFADTLVSVYGLPTPVFSISKFCATDKTFFSAKHSLQATDGISQINNWSWDFGNPNSSTDVSSLDSTYYIYPKTTDPANNDKQNFLVRLTIGTDKGCFKTDTTTIIVGNIPDTDFKWSGICPSDPATSFNDISGFSPVEALAYTWDFGDGDPTNNTLRNPNHKLPGTGSYNVKFKISTIRGCSDSITRKVSILDSYKPTPTDPYIKSFTSSDGFWAADGQNPSWEWGAANKTNIVTGARKVWVTDTTGTYNSDEKSFLNGPCINFKNLTKPMIALKIWSATDNNKLAGTVFQYSKDGGNTWNLVGAPGDGVNWYDSDGILGSPGGQITKQYGWTGVDSTWRVSKIGLSSLAGDSTVRIRLAFGGVNFLLKDGFAFDSVWIGDRDKVSLVENFTNATSSASATADAKINALVKKRPNDLVAINYHTGFPGIDQINLKDQADPGSRVLFYGVPSVPYAAYEGNYNYGTTLDTNDVDKRSLDHAKFKIKLNTVISSDSVFVKALITSQEVITNDFVVHVVVVERNVTNPQGTFQSAMTRMLPNASGTFFNQTFNVGDSSLIYQNWKYLPGDVYHPDSLGVVVFIQDNITHEVYQTAYQFGTGNYGGVVLALNDPEDELKVNVHPNPSTDRSFVIFNKKVTEDFDWEVYDQLGKVIESGKLRKGSEGFALNTTTYPAGMYVVKIENGKNILYNKLVVVH